IDIILFILTLSLTPSILLTMLNIWCAQMSPNSEKLSPQECGFYPLGSTPLPFSISFSLAAILFLLFDPDMALLMSYPTAI
ncbi:NU3M oxidoreductase, partial [Loxia curvirostra]|nr:NU3M oxidoreductase [Loxia curvirostra]